MMHANHREEVDCVYTCDICGIVGLKDTTTADTLCDEKNPIILESMEFPDPVIQVAIEPKTKAGQDKMTMALVKLAEDCLLYTSSNLALLVLQASSQASAGS